MRRVLGESNSDDNIIELGLFSGRRRGWGRATVMIMIIGLGLFSGKGGGEQH